MTGAPVLPKAALVMGMAQGAFDRALRLCNYYGV